MCEALHVVWTKHGADPNCDKHVGSCAQSYSILIRRSQKIQQHQAQRFTEAGTAKYLTSPKHQEPSKTLPHETRIDHARCPSCLRFCVGDSHVPTHRPLLIAFGTSSSVWQLPILGMPLMVCGLGRGPNVSITILPPSKTDLATGSSPSPPTTPPPPRDRPSSPSHQLRQTNSGFDDFRGAQFRNWDRLKYWTLHKASQNSCSRHPDCVVLLVLLLA